MNKVDITKIFINEIANIFKIHAEDIDCNTELFEYGLDSIMLIELMHRLQNKLDIDLEPSDFFAAPTINGLVASLIEGQG